MGSDFILYRLPDVDLTDDQYEELVGIARRLDEVPDGTDFDDDEPEESLRNWRQRVEFAIDNLWRDGGMDCRETCAFDGYVYTGCQSWGDLNDVANEFSVITECDLVYDKLVEWADATDPLAILKELVEWELQQGGYEAPCWERARAASDKESSTNDADRLAEQRDQITG